MRRRLLAPFGAALLALGGPAEGQPAIAHRALTVAGVEAHVLTVTAGARVRPVAGRPGRTVPGWARRSGAIAAINGGYFNHSDGWPVSHVVADGRSLTDPEHNRALLRNPVLKPVLPVIFQHRTEWRALTGPFGCRWMLAPHDAPVPFGASLHDSLQAGPALLPRMDLTGEAFVLKNAQGQVVRDGIGALGKAARSAIGLTPRGDMLLVAVAGSTRRHTGVTMAQLAELMRRLGASEAMALDGGSSTTLSWCEHGRWRTFVGSGEGLALVNSALVVQ